MNELHFEIMQLAFNVLEFGYTQKNRAFLRSNDTK